MCTSSLCFLSLWRRIGVGYFFSTIINHLQDLYTLAFFILLWLTSQINDTRNYLLSFSPAERASWSVLRGEQKWQSVFFSQGKLQSYNNMITPRYRKAHLEGRKTRIGTAILPILSRRIASRAEEESWWEWRPVAKIHTRTEERQQGQWGPKTRTKGSQGAFQLWMI